MVLNADVMGINRDYYVQYPGETHKVMWKAKAKMDGQAADWFDVWVHGPGQARR
jgi:hypothetical protein